MGTIFLGLIIGALFAPTALRPGRAHLRWFGSAALLVSYAIGLIAVRTAVGDVDTFTRFTQNTWPIRRELWWQAWHIALQHPLLGLGVGQFPAGSYWIARESPFTGPGSNCHNLILELAADFGWPAALATCVIGLPRLLRDLRARIALPETALAIGIMLVIAVHSMFEFPLWFMYFAIPAALLFGLAEPARGAGVSVDLRRILPATGLTVLGVGLAFSLNYYWLRQATLPLWLEIVHMRNRTLEDVLPVLSLADSRLFQPEVEHLMLDLNHPPDEHTTAPLERAGRVNRMLPAPEVIARYIILLAHAGRIDEALPHVRRLHVFAHETYPAWRDYILDSTRDLGPQTAPLRHELRLLSCGDAGTADASKC